MNLFEYTYDLVRQIPPGKISSYGAVAKALGDIRASRAVGYMMNQNPNADTMPCYKIVHSDGRLGGFGRGIQDKIRRLQQDNITVTNGYIDDFQQVFFDDFTTTYPLKKLREKQIQLSKKITLQDTFTNINIVAGIDVAYPKNAFEKACGAYIALNYRTKEIIEKHLIFHCSTFPYIPTYLTFRELPFITILLKKIQTKPSVLLLDGNGILHPYKLGLAAHVGATTQIPTIGVAKNLLIGKPQDNKIYYQNELRGTLLHSSPRATKPIYISPGNNISFSTANTIVKNLCTYKQPEPLRQAHLLATKNLHS